MFRNLFEGKPFDELDNLTLYEEKKNEKVNFYDLDE